MAESKTQKARNYADDAPMTDGELATARPLREVFTDLTDWSRLPPEMAEKLERIRKVEHRTRSELVREALQHYIRKAESQRMLERIGHLPADDAMPDELNAIKEGSTDFREGRNMTLKQLRHDLRSPSR